VRALLKKDRFDLVLEKACELGVARIQPVLTRRCVADKLNMERARAADRGGGAMRAHRPAPFWRNL
jgi:16S rRNA U1498 N3-methylase RsmE